MSDDANPPRRRVWKYVLFLGIAGLLVLGALAWYTTTDSFQAAVHRRLVSEIERITGGRVELGALHTTPLHLRVEIRDLTIHGREAPGEVPYAHVGRLLAELKIISLLETEFGFNSVVLEHPVIHIVTYDDGSTNQPQPVLLRASGRTPIEELFALSIDNLELRRGEFFWDKRSIPLDCVAHDVSTDMTYSLLHKKYDGNLLLGKVDITFDGYRPVAWTAEAHFSLAPAGIEIKSLKATSGRSRLQARGRIDDFRDPKIEVKYDADINLAEASGIARRTEVRRGTLRYPGSRRVFFNRQVGSKGSRLARAAGRLARGVIERRILPRSASADAFADASTHAGRRYYWRRRDHSMANSITIGEGEEIRRAERSGEPPYQRRFYG